MLKVVDGKFGKPEMMGMGEALKGVVSEDFIKDIEYGNFVLTIESEATGFFTVSNQDTAGEMVAMLEKAKFGLLYGELEEADG